MPTKQSLETGTFPLKISDDHPSKPQDCSVQVQPRTLIQSGEQVPFDGKIPPPRQDWAHGVCP